MIWEEAERVKFRKQSVFVLDLILKSETSAPSNLIINKISIHVNLMLFSNKQKAAFTVKHSSYYFGT